MNEATAGDRFSAWCSKLALNVFQVRSVEVFKKETKRIVKIQRWWRANHYKKQFQQLVLSSASDINLTSLRRFLHLLDLRNEDFEQELELQSLKGQVSCRYDPCLVSPTLSVTHLINLQHHPINTKKARALCYDKICLYP